MLEKEIGSYIKSLRKRSDHKTLRELELKSGISSATISRIENGKQLPLPDTLKKLAPYLKTPYPELLVICGYMNGSQRDTEERVIDELRRHPALYSLLIKNPEEGVKKLNECWEKQMVINQNPPS